MNWLAIMLALGAAPQDLPDLSRLAAAVDTAKEPAVIIAIASIESGLTPSVRSGKGACCYLGLLGGKYGHSSCKALEADPALCVAEAEAEIATWERSCAQARLDAYNGGWRKCWAGKHRKAARCHRKGCASYSERVAKIVKAIDALKAEPQVKVRCVVAGSVYDLELPASTAPSVLKRSKGLCKPTEELDG